MGFLCQSSSPQSSTVVQQLPDYILDPLKKNLGKAAEITDEPYQTYDGERIADFTQDQLDYMDNIRNNMGANQADIDSAMGGLRGIIDGDIEAKQFDSQTAADYMNPYIDNVMDRARSRAFEADDIARQKRDAKAISADAFGDNSRRFVMEQGAQSDLQDRLLDMEAKQLAAAYESGAKNFAKDADRSLSADKTNLTADLSAAKGIGSLATTDQGLNLRDNASLLGIGSMNQQMNQSGLDLAYSDFLNQQNYPKDQIGFMANILQGAPMGQTTTTYGPPGASTFQNLAGLGISGVGIYGQGGGFSPGGFNMNNLFGGF